MTLEESIKLFCDNLDLLYPTYNAELDAIITRMLGVGYISQSELNSMRKKRGSEEPLKTPD